MLRLKRSAYFKAFPVYHDHTLFCSLEIFSAQWLVRIVVCYLNSVTPSRRERGWLDFHRQLCTCWVSKSSGNGSGPRTCLLRVTSSGHWCSSMAGSTRQYLETLWAVKTGRGAPLASGGGSPGVLLNALWGTGQRSPRQGMAWLRCQSCHG